MTDREAFIKIVEAEIFNDVHADIYIEEYEEDYDLALAYFNQLKNGKTKESPVLTEKGKQILTFMIENKDKYNNIFKAKDIAEGLFISGHSVSGSMRNLVAAGFVDKAGQNPVSYSVTDKGETITS